MRTVIKNQRSDWKKVLSEVQQGFELSLIMLVVHTNDMPEEITTYVHKFIADDTKLLRKTE